MGLGTLPSPANQLSISSPKKCRLGCARYGTHVDKPYKIYTLEAPTYSQKEKGNDAHVHELRKNEFGSEG